MTSPRSRAAASPAISVGMATTSTRCPAPSNTRSAMRMGKGGKIACKAPASAERPNAAKIARRGPMAAVSPPAMTPKRIPITATPETAKATGQPG